MRLQDLKPHIIINRQAKHRKDGFPAMPWHLSGIAFPDGNQSIHVPQVRLAELKYDYSSLRAPSLITTS